VQHDELNDCILSAPEHLLLAQARWAQRPFAFIINGTGTAAVKRTTHFFLFHSQSPGGDQTSAIYLELQQLGFTCWYAISNY
jgi:hypothetical protein